LRDVALRMGPRQSAVGQTPDDPRSVGARGSRSVLRPCRRCNTAYLAAGGDAAGGDAVGRDAAGGGGGASFLPGATAVVPFTTDHLLSPAVTIWKQLGLEPFQVVQKPSLLSFQVPSPLAPAVPTGSRVILPSGVNTILNLMFAGVDEVKA